MEVKAADVVVRRKAQRLTHSTSQPLMTAKQFVEDGLYEEFSRELDEVWNQGMESACIKMNAGGINKKSGQFENQNFCLSYLYRKIFRPKLLEDVLRVLREKFGTRKRTKNATEKETEAAKIYHRKVVLHADPDEMNKYIGYCKSEKQMRFWKALIYKCFEGIEEELRKKGYVGRFVLPKKFYNNLTEGIKKDLQDRENVALQEFNEECEEYEEKKRKLEGKDEEKSDVGIHESDSLEEGEAEEGEIEENSPQTKRRKLN